MKEKLKNRYFILGLFFTAFAFIIVLQLVNLQIVEGEKNNADSQRRVLKESTVIAPRGKITDKFGIPVAVNKQSFMVKIVKTNIDKNKDEMNDMLYMLANIFDKYSKPYSDGLGKYLSINPLAFNKAQNDIIKWEINKDKLGIIKNSEVQTTPEGLFEYLRNVKFKINSKYNDEQAYKIMKLRYEILADNYNYTTGGTVILAKDVGIEAVSEIEERHQDFPGIITDVEPTRQYIDAYAMAHILGYVRPISAAQLDALKDDGYESDDIIGQAGIEKAAESYLKGIDGIKSIEVNTSGRLTEQIDNVPAIPGNDVMLTIDVNLQNVAMKSLADNIEKIRKKGDKNNFGDANAGAVVAMDVNTGEILAMASYPSFDPSIFLASSKDTAAQQAIKELFDKNNKDKPSINRAIQGTYAPGSTFKPLTAIAALEEGYITPTQKILDTGKWVIPSGGWVFKCLEHPNSGHGWLDLKEALETSCNIYFHQIGYYTGIDKLDKWANYFGLGKLSGIDLPNEVAGYMSSKEVKKKRHEGDDWRPTDTAQVAIGQFDNSFTPLQLANYISAIANGGKLYKPYIIKNVTKYDGSIVKQTKPSYNTIPIKASTIEAIKEGMIRVTTAIDGTANQSFQGLPFKVAGKTGTAQTGKESTQSSNALFVCYAPADKPQIAIAVVVEKGAWGSNTAPIARDIIDAYFGLNKTNTANDVLQPDVPIFTQ